MQDDILRGLCAPVGDRERNALVACPKLVTSLKNMSREYPTNHAPETLTHVLLAQLHLKGLDTALRFPRMIEAQLRARAPITNSDVDINELNALETELQGAFDQIQTRMWQKDFSTKTLQDALETLYKIRATVDRLIGWIERRLYGRTSQ